MAISWYNVSIPTNPKGMVWACTIHPPYRKISRPTGRLPRRFAPRNDIFFTFFDRSLPLNNRYRGGGGTPPPYEHIVTWYHSSGGLPHHLSALVRNDVVDCQLSIVNCQLTINYPLNENDPWLLRLVIGEWIAAKGHFCSVLVSNIRD